MAEAGTRRGRPCVEAREPVLFVLRSELCPKEGYGKAWSLRARWTRAAEAAPRLRLGRGTPEGRPLRGQVWHLENRPGCQDGVTARVGSMAWKLTGREERAG